MGLLTKQQTQKTAKKTTPKRSPFGLGPGRAREGFGAVPQGMFRDLEQGMLSQRRGLGLGAAPGGMDSTFVMERRKFPGFLRALSWK